MNLTQRDIFTFMQEKGLGMTQRSNSSGSNGTGDRTNFEGGGFAPPDGGTMPAGGPPDGGGFPGGGFQSNSQSESSTESESSTTNRPAQMNPASLLLDPLIALLKEKIGIN
jgi:hypothetical protein